MVENNFKKEILYSLPKVWLVNWMAHVNNEEIFLKSHGIPEKYLDIINSRKDFDSYIMDYAKDLYQLFMLSFSEKAQLAEYKQCRKNRNDFFGVKIPISTHHNSDLYKNLDKCLKEYGIDSKQYEIQREKCKNYPEYIVVGHNPSLEIIKVFNFVVYLDKDEREVLEWDRPLANSEIKHESYRK